MNYSLHMPASPIVARINLPGSKSITNRALMLAAMADGVSELTDLLIDEHTLTLINALRELGVMIQLDKWTRTCIIGGANGQFPRHEASVRCEDATTATRFLLAAAASSPGTYYFDASNVSRKKPLHSLLKALVQLGATIQPPESQQMPLTVIGIDGLKGGEVDIDPSEKGQFISALLMVAPFAKQSVFIKTEDTLSQPFIEMTCQMMANFNVLVRRLHHGWFSVPVPQRYTALDYHIEPDMTLAAYFFAAAAITGGKITIQKVDRHKSKQGDIVFLNVLEKMGCEVTLHGSGLTVKGPQVLQGVSVDMQQYSDTFMALAALAPFAQTPTTITNIGHLRKKEFDRIALMRTELEKLQVKVEDGNDWMKVYPSIPEAGIVFSHHNDYIAMAFSVIGLRVPGIVIEGKSDRPSYPEFSLLWEQLKGSAIEK